MENGIRDAKMPSKAMMVKRNPAAFGIPQLHVDYFIAPKRKNLVRFPLVVKATRTKLRAENLDNDLDRLLLNIFRIILLHE